MKVQDPSNVITQTGFKSEKFSDIEAGIMDSGNEIKDIEDMLIFLPGKAKKETWIVTTYRNKQSFEDKGLGQKRFEEGKKEWSIQNWNESLLEPNDGYLSHS